MKGKKKDDKSKEIDLDQVSEVGLQEEKAKFSNDLEQQQADESGQEEVQANAELSVLEAKNAELEKALEEEKDSKLRIMAEYDNFKRRTQKEKGRIYSDVVADVNAKWLEIFDNLERATSALEDLDDNSDLSQYREAISGIEKISKQAQKVLSDQGIEEIEALHQTFDPNLHAAVMQDDSGEYQSGTVTEVFIKGYRYKDKVIRHSVVKVAN